MRLKAFIKEMKLQQRMKKKLIIAMLIFMVLVMMPKINYAQNIEWKGIYIFDEESRDEEVTWRNR